jgi:hypothetical protein
MILYRCDRCGSEPSPDKLYDVEITFTPRDLNGNTNPDGVEAVWLGQLCGDCTDVIEPQTLVQPVTDAAVDVSRATVRHTTDGGES